MCATRSDVVVLLRFFVLLAFSIAFVSIPARAQQHEHSSASGAAGVSPACRAKDFGKIHHPVKTGSTQAQRLFEQGMALDSTASIMAKLNSVSARPSSSTRKWPWRIGA